MAAVAISPTPLPSQGVAMRSGVLHSPRAVQVNVAIMRTFVKLREMLATHKDLAQKREEPRSKLRGINHRMSQNEASFGESTRGD